MTKQILLTHGKFALVDDRDYEYLSQFKWHYDSRGYATRNTTVGGREITIRMHRVILGLTSADNCQADHVDGNRLNNTRSNLRIATKTENLRNKAMHKNNTTGYKGVYCRRGRYRAHIQTEGRNIHIGTYNTPEAAARAYDEAAKKYFGKFARLNFPD